MRYSMLLAAFLIATSASSTLAAPVAKKAPTSEPADDSNNNEFFSHPQLSIGFGYLSSYMPVGDVSLYAQMSRRLSLGVSATMGMQIAVDKHTAEDDKTSYSSVTALSEIAIKARYYLLDSLYMTGGLGSRSAQAEYNLSNDSGNNSRTYMVRSFVPSIAVGSQWHLTSSTVFGVDWAGYELPLAAHRSSTGKTEIPPNDATDTNNPRDIAVRNRADKLGKQPNWTFGLVSFGWMF